MFNPYEVLGVSSTASLEECKKAYRTFCVKNHPDNGGDLNKFNEGARAWEMISNGSVKMHSLYESKSFHLSHANLFDFCII